MILSKSCLASVVLATNTFTSDRNSLVMCSLSQDAIFQNCEEFATDIPLNNPNVLTSNQDYIFVSNYGGWMRSGTSFVLKCELPKIGVKNVSCTSILALASGGHITGLKVVDQKLFFTQSFPYNGTLNVNYFVSCDLVPNKRVPQCGPLVSLTGGAANPQENSNVTMDIVANENGIFIADTFGRTVYECAKPDANNNSRCRAKPLPILAADRSIENTAVNTYPVALNARENYGCQISVQGSVFNPDYGRTTCCASNSPTNPLPSFPLTDGNASTQTCYFIENAGIFRPSSVTIDLQKKGVYLTNNFSTVTRDIIGVPASFSYCVLKNDQNSRSNNVYQSMTDCQHFDPNFKDITGRQRLLGPVSSLHIVELK